MVQRDMWVKSYAAFRGQRNVFVTESMLQLERSVQKGDTELVIASRRAYWGRKGETER